MTELKSPRVQGVHNTGQGKSKAPQFAGRYLRYPDLTGKRQAEGGQRLVAQPRSTKPGVPLVTILTVCYNSAKTIAQTIQSVREQTYDNIEYVVVDGNSSDGTLDILRANEDLIDYYVSEPDTGLYYAMNKGLELAQGEYILILNSDDWYERQAVEKLVQAQQTSGADFVSSLANYVDGNGQFVRVQPPSLFDPGVDFRMPLRHETMLVPAWMYNQAGPYDVSYRIIADRVYTAGLFRQGYSHFMLHEPLLNFCMEGVSSVALEGLFMERERALNAAFPGLSAAAMRDLVNLETVSLDRLCEISRNYRGPVLRAAAIAYALDREAQGHKKWQDVDLNAFSPALRKRVAHRQGAVQDRPIKAVGDAQPVVSVILPVYNALETLHESLDSLLAQTLHNIEIICINDNSPDGSQAIIDAYAEKDPRVTKRTNEINVGLGSTRNRGIELARGKYIFHIDPDDVIPQNALAVLVDYAETHGSDMVKGAFLHEQSIMGQAAQSVRKGIAADAPAVINTTLKDSPELLKTTEGHWSFLYRADFAKRVFYPEDLKMGQDSIFLVQALCAARSISVIPDLVYQYRANAASAMNMFNFQKYIDEIEWRYRAWHELSAKGLPEVGDNLLCNYWNVPFFEALNVNLNAEQKQAFYRRLAYAFSAAGNSDLSKTKAPQFKTIFSAGLAHFAKLPALRPDRDLSGADTSGAQAPAAAGKKLRVVAISTSDHGGAGLASLRSVEGLREKGHDARLFCLFQKDQSPHVWQLPIKSVHHAHTSDSNRLRNVWRGRAVITHAEEKTLCARELFSRTGNIVDFDAMRAVIETADIVHLHWASGVIDYDRMADLVKDKPVVWTFHDMNPMTGGCHYSEGCEGYKDQCTACPLLQAASDLPHRAWQQKKAAFDQIKSLSVIAPSDWLADCTKDSSLFAGRAVHSVPNIFSGHDFQPTNKMVARCALGLPLDRRLIVFGADSLDNRRKGGDILCESLRHMQNAGDLSDVEGVLFGASTLDLNIKVHNMGFVNDPQKLSLIYAAADVFAFPSREDNAPQTVIEAMLSGTPVVAFPVGNIPELVTQGETGYIADYENIESFAEGLAWALKDPRSSKALLRGVQAHLDALAHSDPEAAIQRHIDIYENLLAKAKTTPSRT